MLNSASNIKNIAPITDSYPSDILTERNLFRSIQILVKNQESINGGAESLSNYIDSVKGDLQDAYDSLGADKVNPSDAPKQKNLQSRTKKISGNLVKTIYGIALPLPNELDDSQNHQWETSEGVVGSVAGSITNTEMGGVSINKALGEMASASGYRKPLIDPGYFQDYKGTEPREFTFSWDLIPNNATEVDAIMNILYNLKKYTLPKSTVNGMTLLSPYLFDIQIGNPRINSLMNMNNVVCKSMNINFSADGGLQFLPDGMPKHMKLEMTFAERSLVTADFY